MAIQGSMDTKAFHERLIEVMDPVILRYVVGRADPRRMRAKVRISKFEAKRSKRT